VLKQFHCATFPIQRTIVVSNVVIIFFLSTSLDPEFVTFIFAVATEFSGAASSSPGKVA
jgi:hypothetical protein